MTQTLCDITRASDAPSESLQWCVVRTRHQQEQAVATLLGCMGLTHFLPLEQRTRIRGRQRLTVPRPLFPAYLFAAYATEQDRHDIRMIDAVADLHIEAGRRQERLAEQIANLRRTLALHPDADVSNDMRAGDYVVVKSGPMRGVQGWLVRRERKVRGGVVVRDVLRVVIDFFNERGVELDIDADCCERL